MSSYSRSNILILFLCATAMTSVCTSMMQAASIKGIVRYPDGQPAKDFQILIAPASQTASAQVRTQTDSDGIYGTDGLSPGLYAVYPFDQSADYPLRNNMFLSNNPDRVLVSTDTEATLDIILPKPAAMLHGRVIDGVNILTDSQIVLCHQYEPWRSATIRTDSQGKFTYIVPSDELLSISVFAPSKTPVTRSGLSLKPEEVREVQVDVAERKVDDTKTTCKPFK